MGSIAVLSLLAVLLFSVSRNYVGPREYIESLAVTKLSFENYEMNLFIADTPVKKARGLSYVPELAQDTGMLFIFLEPSIQGFWMKDMYISLDIIWLDAQYMIVDMHEHVTPETYPDIFSPETPAQYVIEIPAGKARELLLERGDVLPLGL